MSTIATSASVQFGAGGAARVESRLHLTGRSYIDCYTYDDIAPILALDDAHVQVSITVPDTRLVNDEDVAVACKLAEAVARYVAELEQLAAANRESAEDPDDGAVRADRVA
jgi:hypothetical protein